MDKCVRKIEVRTLSGETTTVSVSSDKSIHELKLLLNLSFPPASSSPNFHLFFKGVKLSLQSQVCSLKMEDGEFVVLIPFTKKDRPQTPKPDFSETSSSAAEQTSSSKKFVDSTYSEMMQDLASLREEETSNIDNNQPKCYTKVGNVSRGPLEAKRKRVVDCDSQEGRPYDFLWSVWRSKNRNALEGQNCEKFVEVLKSMTCLLDPQSGKCMLLREASMRSSNGGLWGGNDNDCSCLCPVWLKKIIEAFAFLSIFCAYLHLRKEKVTLSCVKDALNQLGKFGVQVGIEDIEHLSVLCPKVVQFANDDMKSKNFGDSIVIINAPSEERYQLEDNLRTGHKDISLSKIFNALKKWESSFKSNMWEAVKLLMSKIRKAAIALSLEDLLTFAKERGTVVSGNEGKQPRRNSSSASSSHAVQRRCNDTSQLLPLEMVEHLQKGIGSHGQPTRYPWSLGLSTLTLEPDMSIFSRKTTEEVFKHIVHVEDISPRKAAHVEIPNELSDNAKSALKCIGISKLYSHQAESVMASLSGKNVVVATMTSSGKSLCYNLPVLEALSQNLLSCALYLFPTKALAQDQLKALLTMIEAFGASINIGIYDGDTSQKDRIWLRDNARLLITNPDMLHMSILPSHRQFSRILLNLRYVVVDEAHAYKGAFGCHTAFILRRLRRLCSHVYGSDPSFVFCTATSANPREHCMELANMSTLELIKNDGSPSSRKHFVLWNPTPNTRTVLDKVHGNMHDIRDTSHKNSSPISEVSYLFAEIVQHGLRCITFCKSRKLCELVLSCTREILEGTAPHLVNSVCAYRAGYVAQDRRRIESDFFGGKLCGIAATNALELGIDVGHIDVTLHLGFPGSIASLWQQAGRSGRREKPSLAIYVAFEGPLDQYFMKFPQKLFNSPIECCHIDAENQQVLEQHLACAALEHPVSLVYDEKYFGCGLNGAILTLKNRGYLSSDLSCESSAKIWSYIGHEKMPSHAICIRAIDTVKYKVIDMQKDEVIEEIEESKSFFQVYEGAVYLHQGHSYLVKELNISNKIAFCQKADLKYYTKTRDYTDIHVVGGNIAYPSKGSKNQLLRTTAQAHVCKVTTTWFGFHRIRRGSNKIFDTVELYLPKYSYESQAVWIQVPQSVKVLVEKNFSFRSGLHAASHSLLHVVPIFLRCNLSDLAPECPNPHDARYFPERILLYDQHPGGTGVSKQIQPYFTELLTAALELLTSCLCSGDTGCPNCVQNLSCHEYNELIHKDAAIMIIKGVLDAEKSYFESLPDSFESPTVEVNQTIDN